MSMGDPLGTSFLPPRPAGDSAPRRVAARCLDVVHRTVLFGLHSEASTRAVRYLDRTCMPWLERVPADVLDAIETALVDDLKLRISNWSDHLSLGARSDLLGAVADDLSSLRPLLSLVDSDSLVPRAALLPMEAPPRPSPPPAPEAPPPAVVTKPTVTETPTLEVSSVPAAEESRPEEDESTEDDLSLGDAVEDVVENLAAAEVPVAVPPAHPQAGPRPPRPSGEPTPEPARTSEGPRPGRRGRSRRDEIHTPVGLEEPPPEPSPEPTWGIRDVEGPGRTLAEWGHFPFPLREALERAGIRTVADLMLAPPVRYALLPRAVSPSEPLVDGTWQVVRGVIRRRLTRLRPLGRQFEVMLSDGTADVACRWTVPVDDAFRQRLVVGSRVAVHGVIEHEGEGIVLHQGEPVWLDSRGQGRIACYGIEDVPDAEMRAWIRTALDVYADHIQDILPDDIRQGVRLLDLSEALKRMHMPNQSLRRGRERLAFDELLLYQIGMGLRRRRAPQERGLNHTIVHKLVSQIQLSNPMTMNDDQEIAFSEIRRDLARSRPMNRLLQGEVGTGKGVIAMMSAVMVAESRDQVVFVTPDALAAEHRYLFAEPLLRSVGLVPALVVDRPNAAQVDAIRRGEVHVIIATPKFTRPWPEFRRLGLVIVEERGEYGDISLADLPSRGGRPDLLVLTAAPIPTSLTLTVFGGMDLSLVGGTGVGNARTEIFAPDARMDAYAKVMAEIDAGRQAYVVLPLRGEETLDQKDLARYVDALRTDAFPGTRIGVFSGVKSREERQRVFLDFRHRRLDVLLTTTIIEDGPRVGNATAMLVEHADTFDLIRLHRLRAHVGRGVRPGMCCFVLQATPDPVGQSNLELICRETEGFRIAEVDLMQRGVNALLGERAREAPAFRYVDPLEHRELLVRARTEAFDIIASDPSLANPKYQWIRNELDDVWERWFPGRPALARVKKPSRGPGQRRRRRG